MIFFSLGRDSYILTEDGLMVEWSEKIEGGVSIDQGASWQLRNGKMVTEGLIVVSGAVVGIGSRFY